MSATEQKLLIKLAKDLAWKLQGAFLARVVMEEFVFKYNPPSPSEKAIYEALVTQCELVIRGNNSDVLSNKTGSVRSNILLDSFVGVFGETARALYFQGEKEKLSSNLGASPEELNAIAEEENELDSSFRDSKKCCGTILSTLLLNAAKAAGKTDRELIKLIIERCGIIIEIGPIFGSYEVAMSAIEHFEWTSFFSVSGT